MLLIDMNGQRTPVRLNSFSGPIKLDLLASDVDIADVQMANRKRVSLRPSAKYSISPCRQVHVNLTLSQQLVCHIDLEVDSIQPNIDDEQSVRE